MKPAYLWIGLMFLLVVASAKLPALLMPKFASKPLPAPVRLPIQKRAIEPADVATTKSWKDGTIDPRFTELHNRFLAQAKSDRIDLLFLGDSITEAWATAGKDVWTKSFSAYHPANFGIAGDRTQHLLWRIENGELDTVKPKVVVLLIGTNNTDYPADDIIRADLKIVREIRERLPQSKLLLMGIFPREYKPDDEVRAKIRTVNSQLCKLDDRQSIHYLDIGDNFLTPAGTARIDLLPDLLHLGEKGYQIWADAVRPLLEQMMN